MHDEDQTPLPASFRALYCDARDRLTIPLRALRTRYDLCEDLAQHLMEYARGVHFDLGIAEDEVLRRCRHGLLAPPAQVSPAEATWVVTRLAELQGWPWPTFENAPTPADDGHAADDGHPADDRRPAEHAPPADDRRPAAAGG